MSKANKGHGAPGPEHGPETRATQTCAAHVVLNAEVVRQVRQHGRSSMKTEVCGVLIGEETGGGIVVRAGIAGANAAQGGAHVTFTQETWQHIYEVKDRDYPEQRIVGWYHSHPGFGVFLSEHDTFIQEHFFSAPTQIAWVYDPHTDEEGCFGWVNGEIERLHDYHVRDFGDPVAAGGNAAPDDLFDAGEARVVPMEDRRVRWADIVFTVMSYLAAAVLGGLLALYLFPPPTVLVPVPQDKYEELLRQRDQQQQQRSNPGPQAKPDGGVR